MGTTCTTNSHCGGFGFATPYHEQKILKLKHRNVQGCMCVCVWDMFTIPKWVLYHIVLPTWMLTVRAVSTSYPPYYWLRKRAQVTLSSVYFRYGCTAKMVGYEVYAWPPQQECNVGII